VLTGSLNKTALKGVEMKEKEKLNEEGKALLGGGNYKEALEKFNQALRSDGFFGKAYLNRGTALYLLGRFDKAFSDFTRAVKLLPDVHNPYFGRGILLMKMGRFEEALSDLNQAVKLCPDDAKIRYSRILLLMKMGRFRPISDSGSGLNTFFGGSTEVSTPEMDAFQLVADG
jgi:tetratricopeptide (TPR) repeat protein